MFTQHFAQTRSYGNLETSLVENFLARRSCKLASAQNLKQTPPQRVHG